MKNFIKSFRLTLVFCVFFSVCYILVLWIFAQFAGPNSGNAEVVELNGKVVGAANVGQSFTEDIYFWGRPSCAGDGYDATSSAGSLLFLDILYLVPVPALKDCECCCHMKSCIPASLSAFL